MTELRWTLGCVNLCPVARGSQEAGFMQPRDNLIAHLCTVPSIRILRKSHNMFAGGWELVTIYKLCYCDAR